MWAKYLPNINRQVIMSHKGEKTQMMPEEKGCLFWKVPEKVPTPKYETNWFGEEAKCLVSLVGRGKTFNAKCLQRKWTRCKAANEMVAWVIFFHEPEHGSILSFSVRMVSDQVNETTWDRARTMVQNKVGIIPWWVLWHNCYTHQYSHSAGGLPRDLPQVLLLAMLVGNKRDVKHVQP